MADASRANWSDLSIRIASALVMAGLALATAWWGGPLFALFWFLAAAAVLCEWLFLIAAGRRDGPAAALGVCLLAVSTLLVLSGQGSAALLTVVGGTAAMGCLARVRGMPQPLLAAAALPYAACVVLPVIALRLDEPHGMRAIFVLFAIVWGSDVMAYFTGRTLGGPKLWPRVSPKKTWSGFIGGTLFAALAAGVVGGSFLLVPVGAALAAISQGGDLLESALKRRFDAKDASHLIPGHGGVMDRLDGFLAAALAALLIGLVHAGLHPAQGFIVW
ncbi:phosphatidate cytidylyltransferase [Labrys okinawensis]|uniref:Phosphatidate cytidylyltransferase n=1 Tax=Labrys okinawensis TaxID=346911 RepID=A0A2S9Q6X4_9HYPH|nr:phosphatidate cytidylyltransferase [Labrys okinawensis]PRH85089.1 phosphatidate cytidylyltransferase [Labrys okinawensis]